MIRLIHRMLPRVYFLFFCGYKKQKLHTFTYTHIHKKKAENDLEKKKKSALSGAEKKER